MIGGIFFLIGTVIKAFFTLLFAALAVGVVRLFVLGHLHKYYDTLKDDSLLKKGDILLLGKDSVLHSWYIQLSNVLTRKIKHRFWTHAAIYCGNGKVWEATPEGIHERDLKDYFESGHIVRAFRHKYITSAETVDEVIEYCKSKKGPNYGTMGTVFYTLSTFVPFSFNFLFDCDTVQKWLHMDDKYYCSELIVDAFEAGGNAISPYDGWRVKPTDFISNPLLIDVNEKTPRENLPKPEAVEASAKPSVWAKAGGKSGIDAH